LYSSDIRVVASRGVRRVGHVAHMERKMCFGWGTPRKENLEDLLADGSITLKRFLSEMGGFGSE